MARRPHDEEPEPAFVDPGPPGTWVDRASCGGMVQALLDFFGKRRVDWSMSKQVCSGCPVRWECLEYALGARNVHGVWGGLDPLELRFALGRDAQGAIWTYDRSVVKCPYCRANTNAVPLDDFSVQRKCPECNFSWVRAERRRAGRQPRRRRQTH